MIEEYGNGRTKINGIEQGPSSNNPMKIENNKNVRPRSEIMMTDNSEKLQIEQDERDETVINKSHREKDELKQRMIQEMEIKYEQERLREQWERQRRHELFLQQRQQEQILFQQQQQQQMLIYQQRQRQQQMYAASVAAYYQYNPYYDDDDQVDFQNVYYASSASPGPSSSTSHYHHLY